jgi:hypothetical protein
MSERLQRHPGVTDVLPVIVAQRHEGPGADLIYRTGRNPEVTHQASSGLVTRYLCGRYSWEAKQEREDGGLNPLGAACERCPEALGGIARGEPPRPHAATTRREWVEHPTPTDRGDRAVAPEDEPVLGAGYQSLLE